MHKPYLLIGLISILLTGCFGGTKTPIEDLEVGGARIAAFTTARLTTAFKIQNTVRPSAVLGVYGTLFIAQGSFQNVTSALLSIEAQKAILAGQIEVQNSEVFALMKEFGSILEVDIIDMLNRAERREEALDTYLRSLENILQLVERKHLELDTQIDAIRTEKNAQRKIAQGLDRDIRNALKNKDFTTAGSKQEESLKAESVLAEIHTKEAQIKDTVRTLEKLIDIAKERQIAMTENRRILISGLQVVDVPGVEDLNILLEK